MGFLKVRFFSLNSPEMSATLVITLMIARLKIQFLVFFYTDKFRIKTIKYFCDVFIESEKKQVIAVNQGSQ